MPTKLTVQYEENIQLSIEKVFDICIQWLEGQHKAKIAKKTKAPTHILAKQGTMMTNSGFDPLWKKSIRINLFDMGGDKTLIKLDATPISRNIRSSKIEKLKQAWWDGLFKGLFSLLVKMEGGTKEKKVEKQPEFKPVEQLEIQAKFCPGCGKEIKEAIKYCPACGVDISE